MLFNEALKIHRSVTVEHSHSDILGDAFLLANNRLYRQIRLQTIDLDVTLAEASLEYLLMPFNQLDLIVSTKRVPFVPNARLMTEIESKHPGVFDLQQMPIPESYQLHESAHIIADHCCANVAVQTREDKILKSILCESFANTVDAMVCAYATSEVHQLFLRLNCYTVQITATREQIKNVRESFGKTFTARLIVLSYVFANFLKEEVPPDVIEALITEFGKPYSKPTEEALKDCTTLSLIGQKLDTLFRVQTASNYFQLQGFRDEIYDLLNFDFAKLLKRKDFSEAFDSMISRLA